MQKHKNMRGFLPLSGRNYGKNKSTVMKWKLNVLFQILIISFF